MKTNKWWKKLLIASISLSSIILVPILISSCDSNTKDDDEDNDQSDNDNSGNTDEDNTNTLVSSDSFNHIILKQLSKVYGGGYSTAIRSLYQNDDDGNASLVTHSTFRNLQEAFIFDETDENTKPEIDITKAYPSFCSSATYIILLKALEEYDSDANTISWDAWKNMAPGNIDNRYTDYDEKYPSSGWDTLYEPLDDGFGVWGRANANSIGIPALFYDLDVGESFYDINQAMPGDFLKIFWVQDDNETRVGVNERGHMVIYLGQTEDRIIYWSSNNINGSHTNYFTYKSSGSTSSSTYYPNGGYGISYISKSSIGGMVFSRVTKPENFDNAKDMYFTNQNDYLVSCSDDYDQTWENAKVDINKYAGIEE